jgi:hypothetical protein
MSEDAQRLVEGYPSAYSFTPHRFASPERPDEIARAMKENHLCLTHEPL